ncbi:MAG: SDR family oxidoreductase [Polyangiaceae bacterium]
MNQTRIGTDNVAIVTGAGTGIGAATALRLGKRAWTVVLGGRRREPLEFVARHIHASGGRAIVVPCDVTVASDVSRLVDAAGARLDVLVHSAGQGHCLRIDELDEKEFRSTLDVAVVGAFLTAKAALPRMRETSGGDGHIIQICSLASGGTWNREIGYGTAKAAQLKFALHLSEQLAEERNSGTKAIHSHAICPGTVATPFGIVFQSALSTRRWPSPRTRWPGSSRRSSTILRLLQKPLRNFVREPMSS